MALLLKNAHVVDPSVELDGVVDVLIDGDKIAEVGENLAAEGAEVRDLSGKYLVPGLVASARAWLRGQRGHRERHPRCCQGRLHRRVRHAQHRSRHR
jgi:dihydroorotase-like cyclic amidohydrolase